MGDNGHEYAVCAFCQRDISHLHGWIRSPYTICRNGRPVRSRNVLGEKDLEEAAVKADLREKARTETVEANAREKAQREREFKAALVAGPTRQNANLEEERVEVAEVASEESEEDEVKMTETTTGDADDTFSSIALYESLRGTEPINLPDNEREAMEDYINLDDDYINLDEDYMGALQLYFQIDGIAVADDDDPPVDVVVVDDEAMVEDEVVGPHL